MKKLFLKIIAAAFAVVTVFAFAGCSKTSRLEITLNLYDADSETTVERTLSFDLYGNLAPKAVAAVKELINDGYFADCVFYKQNKDNGTTANMSNLVFFGGLKRTGDTVTRNEKVAIPDADFTKNGTTGSNLTNSKGYLGLWRTWYSAKNYNNSGFENSYSTIYAPTTSISGFNNNFCVFAKYSDADDLDVLDEIIAILGESDYVTEYTCWYTANTDGNLVDADGGVLAWEAVKTDEYAINGTPVWNCMKTEEFEEIQEDLDVYSSEADKSRVSANKSTEFDSYTITIANADKLSIVSIEIIK